MKKKTFLLSFGTLAAIALFTACASYDGEELTIVENLEEPATKTVKAQFSISIPMSSGASGNVTRQSAATVQNGENITGFRGINHIKMFPSTVATGVFDHTSTIGTPINLSTILKPAGAAGTVNNYIPASTASGQALTENNNSVLYGDVSLETGTQTFLFYGKAIDNDKNETGITTADDMFKFGVLDATSLNGTPANTAGFQFKHKAITTSDNGNTKRTAIVNYLNSIANAKDATVSPAVAWSATSGIDLGLAALYTNFTLSKMAGSSRNLEEMISQLYRSLKEKYSTTTGEATTWNNKLAEAIYTAITANTNVSFDAEGNATFTGDLAGYPNVSDNLPDGAAVIGYTAGTGFQYKEDQDLSTSLNVTSNTNYVYPANLYYWVKSPILTSENHHKDLDFSAYAWDVTKTVGENTVKGIFSEYTDGTAIANKTRSVLLTSPVQYGVGRFDMQVRASGENLDDNGALFGESKTAIPISNIKLTGILISKQKAVDWKFEPISGAAEYTVYDNICKSTDNATGIQLTKNAFSETTADNSTLVLETPGADDEAVNVALEFLYTGTTAWWGKSGRIYPNTHFYLVGALDMAAANTEKVTAAGNKVFKQDYKTLAKFTVTDLKKAENTLPDLRNPSIELGLSVDLKWETGNTFNISF